ncbi:hypothetical protein D9M70_605920 [compost metagenome]
MLGTRFLFSVFQMISLVLRVQAIRPHLFGTSFQLVVLAMLKLIRSCMLATAVGRY